MRTYVIKRLLLAIPTLLLLSVLLFALLRILPGDIAQLVYGEGEGSKTTQLTLDTIKRELGLDRPLHVQYVTWLWDAVRGDLGLSLRTRKPVMEEILHRAPLTIQLGLLSIAIGTILGVPLGILSAIYRNSWLDFLMRFIAIFFHSAPGFWLGLLFLLFVVRFLNWSPPLGYNLLWENPKENLLQLTWPALILGFGTMSSKLRFTRSQMLEVIREDYIRTARAKGLAEKTVIMRHALKNALIPVVTIVGSQLGYILSGSVIMEQIFAIPGIGRMFIEAINLRDFTIIQGVAVVIGASLVFANLAVDLLYGWLDPRISYS